VRKIALALAATALLGLSVPAFAIETGSATQTRKAVTQSDVMAKAGRHAKTKMVHHRRGTNKLVRHATAMNCGVSDSHRHAKHHRKHVHVKA
jgi:hypothetical protein